MLSSLVIGLFLLINTPTNTRQAGEINSSYYNTLKPNMQYELSKNFGSDANASVLFQQASDKAAREMNKKTRNANTSWQLEGPHNVGGRINAIAFDPGNTNIIYVGTPAGGIFKTNNGGASWVHLFTKESNLQIGSLEIDPNNSSILYAGTGDKAFGSGSRVGNGIYKSTDAGSTWTHIGLPNSGSISRIRVNPNNSNVIYAAALGSNLVNNAVRGLYKSTDAGTTWTKVLNLSTIVGVHDVILDPTDPNIIYATGMAANHSVSSGTSVYKSTDAGANWVNINNGLPTTAYSKVTIAQAQNNNQILYAAICNASFSFSGFYKSTDGGTSWTLQYNGNAIDYYGFGWYFGEIRVNPADDNKVYNLNVNINVSTNGGQSWGLNANDVYSQSGSDVHADKHDLVFLDNTGNNYLLATDGGIYKTSVGGGLQNNAWNDLTNMPITQYYETNYNPSDAANYYAGAQDNGTSLGSLNSGINNWSIIPLGDGFRPDFDPTDPSAIYIESQFGNIVYASPSNTQYVTTSIAYNKNWNTPYLISKAFSTTMYLGADRMMQNDYLPNDYWVDISPVLAPAPYTISTIDQSALNNDLLYAGTNNGNLHVRKTLLGNWLPIRSGLPNFAVSSVVASPSIVSNVFVAHTGYRQSNNNGHIHFSEDYGTTWTSLANNTLPDFAINDIYVRADGKDSSIAVATDGGVYATSNRGAFWYRVGNNMPIIPVYDLDYNVSQNRLVAATFATGIHTIPLDSVFIYRTPVFPVAVTDIEKTPITLYPNPSKDYIVTESASTIFKRATVFDLLGRPLQEYTLNGSLKNKIDISKLASGKYLLRLQDGENNNIKKFSKL